MSLFLRVFLVSSLIAAGAAHAAAPAEDAAVTAAIDCLELSDDSARLSCLEKAATTLKATRIIREEEQAQAAEKQREEFGLAAKDTDRGEETVEEFGANALVSADKGEDGRLKSITAKVVEIRMNSLNVATLTLENGQVWRQLDSDDKTLRFGDRERLFTAKVKRSVFGNYMLTVPELHTTIRVRRIK